MYRYTRFEPTFNAKVRFSFAQDAIDFFDTVFSVQRIVRRSVTIKRILQLVRNTNPRHYALLQPLTGSRDYVISPYFKWVVLVSSHRWLVYSTPWLRDSR